MFGSKNRGTVIAKGLKIVGTVTAEGLVEVNGRIARGALRLRHGDRLKLGETVIRFADPLEAHAEPGAAAAPLADGGRGHHPAGAARWWRPAGALLLALAALALALP